MRGLCAEGTSEGEIIVWKLPGGGDEADMDYSDFFAGIPHPIITAQAKCTPPLDAEKAPKVGSCK